MSALPGTHGSFAGSAGLAAARTPGDPQWFRWALVALVGLVIVLGVLGMGRGVRRRAARQAWIADLPAVPELGPTVAGPFPGLYVASTLAGDWLDRVVVHGLGNRGRAELEVHAEGVLVRRVGEDDLFVPGDALVGVRLDRGLAQKVVEPGGLLVLSWMLRGGQGGRVAELDTGFRADDVAGHVAAARAVDDLVCARGRRR